MAHSIAKDKFIVSVLRKTKHGESLEILLFQLLYLSLEAALVFTAWKPCSICMNFPSIGEKSLV